MNFAAKDRGISVFGFLTSDSVDPSEAAASPLATKHRRGASPSYMDCFPWERSWGITITVKEPKALLNATGLGILACHQKKRILSIPHRFSHDCKFCLKVSRIIQCVHKHIPVRMGCCHQMQLKRQPNKNAHMTFLQTTLFLYVVCFSLEDPSMSPRTFCNTTKASDANWERSGNLTKAISLFECDSRICNKRPTTKSPDMEMLAATPQISRGPNLTPLAPRVADKSGTSGGLVVYRPDRH